jgi:hypothetical protein
MKKEKSFNVQKKETRRGHFNHVDVGYPIFRFKLLKEERIFRTEKVNQLWRNQFGHNFQLVNPVFMSLYFSSSSPSPTVSLSLSLSLFLYIYIYIYMMADKVRFQGLRRLRHYAFISKSHISHDENC